MIQSKREIPVRVARFDDGTVQVAASADPITYMIENCLRLHAEWLKTPEQTPEEIAAGDAMFEVYRQSRALVLRTKPKTLHGLKALLRFTLEHVALENDGAPAWTVSLLEHLNEAAEELIA